MFETLRMSEALHTHGGGIRLKLVDTRGAGLPTILAAVLVLSVATGGLQYSLRKTLNAYEVSARVYGDTYVREIAAWENRERFLSGVASGSTTSPEQTFTFQNNYKENLQIEGEGPLDQRSGNGNGVPQTIWRTIRADSSYAILRRYGSPSSTYSFGAVGSAASNISFCGRSGNSIGVNRSTCLTAAVGTIPFPVAPPPVHVTGIKVGFDDEPASDVSTTVPCSVMTSTRLRLNPAGNLKWMNTLHIDTVGNSVAPVVTITSLLADVNVNVGAATSVAGGYDYTLQNVVPSGFDADPANVYKITVQTVSESVSFLLNRVPGDYNGDGTVSDPDFTLFRLAFGGNVPTGSALDANNDGFVSAWDFVAFRMAYGQTPPPVPVGYCVQ